MIFPTKTATCGGRNSSFSAPAGRGFCRENQFLREKECNIVGTKPDESTCQLSPTEGRPYVRSARAPVFPWGKSVETGRGVPPSPWFQWRAGRGPQGGGRRPPPGRVPPRHARSMQICSKLFFLPSDTIRSKIAPFAAFWSFVQPCLSGSRQRDALGVSQIAIVGIREALGVLQPPPPGDVSKGGGTFDLKTQ